MGRLIDADELKRRLKVEPYYGGIITLYEVNSVIDRQPTIEERKKGEWYCSDDMFETGVCSVCKWDSEEAWKYPKRLWKFCPHCKAEMSGEDATRLLNSYRRKQNNA